MEWLQFKIFLSEVTELSQDALHIYVALLVQFGAALVLRKPIAHPLPWLLLLGLLLANEGADLRAGGRPVEEWQVLGGIQDLWNTMAVPTTLMLVARFAPAFVTGRESAAVAADPAAEAQPEGSEP